LDQPADPAATDDVAIDTADLTADPNAPLAPAEAQPPATLALADLGLQLAIEPMGWVVTENNGERTTEWIVPTDTVGWHANSVGAGGAGNLLLSGHQALGSAVFAPLALGDIVVGQEIELIDRTGESFRYRVIEVSEPIPILGATEEDNALARSYVQPSESAILTLMTGWPDFTTTHRIFAVAEYLGRGTAGTP
jgi:hypothetical protein